MPKEPRGFREELETIRAFHPKGEEMNLCDVARYMGKDKRTVTARLGIGGPTTRTQLALILSKRQTIR